MTQILSALLITSFFSLAQADTLKKFADPVAPLSDFQSEEEILAAEANIQQNFGDIDFESFENESKLDFSIFSMNQFKNIDTQGVVPSNLLSKALKFYNSYSSRFANKKYLTIVDFSMRSNLARFFVVNMSTGAVTSVHTAHGRYSDPNNDGYVDSVGNVNGSGKSSKGFYQVSEIYYGKYNRSIRLDGLSSTNSNVRRRAIVIHGADYVKEQNTVAGRSLGCFALAWSVKDSVVDKIAGGSLLYADFSK